MPAAERPTNGEAERERSRDEDKAQSETPAVVLALDEALDRLQDLDPRKASIIELRFFAGLTVEETATLLEVSAPTITKDTRLARAWLHGEIKISSCPVSSET